METYEFKKGYWKTKYRMILLGLVIIGALNWGATALGYNLVELLSNQVNRLANREMGINKAIYLIVAVAAILLAVRRDTWLPFLGYSVLPSSLIPLKENKDAKINVKVKVRPNSKVAYWASDKFDTIPEVIQAYGSFENSGVVMSDADGIALLPIKESSAYKVPSGRVIPRHVHYRTLGLPWGMVGRVETVYY